MIGVCVYSEFTEKLKIYGEVVYGEFQKFTEKLNCGEIELLNVSRIFSTLS